MTTTPGGSRFFFWKAPPWRALLEGWVAIVLMILLLHATVSTAPGLVISMFILMQSITCAGLAGLRMRPSSGIPGSVVIREALAGTGLAIGMIVCDLGVLAWLGELDMLNRAHIGLVGVFFGMALTLPGFLATRFASLLWFRWNRLRKVRFRWALTHAHLVVIVLVGCFTILMMILLTAQFNAQEFAKLPADTMFGRIVIWSFTLFFLLVLAGLVGLAIFLPPTALFSFLIARRLTRRLETLTRATNTLSGGDLSARVVVEGEDEVATLQTNFNAMASDLEKSTLALQAEKEKVLALLQLQRELTASVSHELRTPVATLSGYLESLQERWEAEPAEVVEHDLNVMAREADRLQTLLADLLTLSQAELNQLSLDLQPVLVQDLVCQVVDTVAGLAWERGRVQVVAEVEDGLPWVRADLHRLEQVLINLVQNALRYTPPGGVVAVAVSRAGAEMRLEVADTGAGVAAEDLEHIWQRFYRAGQDHGAGLGLALVKELTEAMGGRVSVESSPGQGSIFSIFLPFLST